MIPVILVFNASKSSAKDSLVGGETRTLGSSAALASSAGAASLACFGSLGVFGFFSALAGAAAGASFLVEADFSDLVDADLESDLVDADLVEDALAGAGAAATSALEALEVFFSTAGAGAATVSSVLVDFFTDGILLSESFTLNFFIQSQKIQFGAFYPVFGPFFTRMYEPIKTT
jgi:hypothetical protein